MKYDDKNKVFRIEKIGQKNPGGLSKSKVLASHAAAGEFLYRIQRKEWIFRMSSRQPSRAQQVAQVRAARKAKMCGGVRRASAAKNLVQISLNMFLKRRKEITSWNG